MNINWFSILLPQKAIFLLLFILNFHAELNCQPSHINFENFTTVNGLSNNLIHDIFQDKKGWMWFGAYHGLNRFDGYNFSKFYNHDSDSADFEGIKSYNIFEDNDGRLLVGAGNNGVYCFNRNREVFENFPIINDSIKNKKLSVNTIKQDREGNYWVGTNNGIFLLNRSGKTTKVFRNIPSDPNSLVNDNIKNIFIDRSGKVWIGTITGIDIIDLKNNKIHHLGRSIPYLADEICAIFCDTDSKIWIGTFSYGIIIIDPLTYKYEHLELDPSNERSVTVRAIIKDKEGYYWIGTRGGLYIYSRELRKSTFSKHDEREKNSLVHNSILCIFEDAKGDIWIGTRGGISYVVKERQVFKCFHEFPNDNNYLNNNEIYAFLMNPLGKLWIGTENGGINIYNPGDGKFSYLKFSTGNLARNCVKALISDQNGDIWAGTYMGGIDVYSYKTKHIAHFENNPKDKSSLSNNKVWALYNDSKNNIWVGSEAGLDRYDPKSQSFIHYNQIAGNRTVIWIMEDSGNDLWIGTNDELIIYNTSTLAVKKFSLKSRMMHEDLSGKFWVATLVKGLALFEKDKGVIKWYDKSKGIADNQTYCILEDKSGYFWISTINGLSRFDPQKETFKNFDQSDGLQNNQFRYGACFKTPNDELIFGSITGFNIFKPADIKNNEYEPPIVFTDFKIFNKHVPVRNEKNAILTQSISETQKIVLPYNKNAFSIEFAALNYAQSAKNKYAYKLKGFDKEWNDAGYQRSATYTNLDPGEYEFYVKASNNDDVWSKKYHTLTIVVLPPYWKTWWFKLLVIFIFFNLLFGVIKFLINRNQLKHELVYERERVKMLHELDMMKINFFTNVSHELRTPLTLITAPLEKIIQTDMPIEEIKTYAKMMNRNAKNLLRLINQLLDFRKIETGNLGLDVSQGDIVFFIKEIVSSFSVLAQEKNIKLIFSSNNESIYTCFDDDKIEKIINNLVSNSLKYTPNDGMVKIILNTPLGLNDNINKPKEEPYLEIIVEDTGIGISEFNFEKIFDKFFQIGKIKTDFGSGIGLALTKELVKLHNGRIFVESNLNKGTKFIVCIPFISTNGIIEETLSDSQNHTISDPKKLATNEMLLDEENLAGKIILIIDDNADIRFFLRSNFEKEFTVVEATNGKDGLNLAFQYIPDIIVSDILMPLIDGKEFCKRLKKDERTSHIPVILLTALSSKTNKMEGIVAGADDYITKPFDIALLKSKIENLLEIRNLLREKYSKEMVLKPTNIIIDNPDAKFLHKVTKAIENNLNDSDFDIDKLSMEVGVSRTQLYRKLTVLTNTSAKYMIRNFRMKRAAQLLEQKKMNISEVAYAVGFKDLSHFRKCFRQEFGMSASKYEGFNNNDAENTK